LIVIGDGHTNVEAAGVAIMALGALAANPDCGLKIIPCGMNYFHAHKFRSRAVVEFGSPVDIDPELIEKYKNGDRREAVGKLLEDIYNSLVAVTVTAPDYDTLMLIQAVRRLYNPKGKKLPLPMVIELNRRLVKGYSRYKDDPRIINLKKSVLAYNREIIALNIRDHQVEYAKLPIIKVLFTLLYRLGKIFLLAMGVLPGLILFAPVFIAGKLISIKKSKEALAASTVKIQARDVVATWKLLVSMALAPALYNLYNILLAVWCYKNRIQGYVPLWVPIWAIFILGWIVFPAITYAALRFGEIGMDITKSLRPLFVALSPAHGSLLVKLRERRNALAAEVTDVINTLGPEMFPDFDHARIIADPFRDSTISPTSSRGSHANLQNLNDEPTTPTSPTSPTGTKITLDSPTPDSERPANGNHHLNYIPINESFRNLSNVALFASRPSTPYHTRSRSRTNSTGFPVQGFSSLDSNGGFEELSKKIRGGMRERNQRRKSETEKTLMMSAGLDGYGSGTSTPGSEAEHDGLKMTSGNGHAKKDI
jgi:glycerol-3-phosphate O-acyltransferase/dihydroxyacetone phosphate acyltransferase